jgi:ATP/maltotriose-dependent transcriptional regulator MalT/DNA-binding SARP family transcriptional activator
MSTYYNAAKLRAPVVGNVVGQDRLLPLLGKPDGTALWIHGPAGFGKSTLAALSLQETELPHVWYRIDEGDADLGNLLDGVLESLRRNVNFPLGRLPAMKTLLSGSPEYAASYFWRAVANHLPERMAIVFDEVENLPPGASGLLALKAACQELPDGVSVLFTSRNEPPAMFARLVVNEQLRIIGPESLRLSKAETQALLAQSACVAEPAIIDAVYASTHGWPAAVSLMARHGANMGSVAPSHFSHVATLAAYLEAEILHDVPAACHDDLALVALTDTITPGAAHWLTGGDSILTQLDTMARQGFFVQRLEGAKPAYALHPLLRASLRKKLQQKSSATAHGDLLLKAARFLLAENALSEAVELLHQAGNFDEIGLVIETHGEQLFTGGHSDTLRGWLSLLPESTRKTRPWLVYWDAATLLTADPGRAKQLMGQAYQGFAAPLDALGRALAWAGGVDAVFLEYASFAEMDCWLECLESDIKPLPPALPAPVAAKLLQAEFSALSFRRPESSALRHVHAQLAGLADQSTNRTFASDARGQLFIYALWRGDASEAAMQLAALEEIASLANSAPSKRLFVLVLELAYCLFTAQVEVCEDKSTTCLHIASEIGIHHWDCIVWGHRVCALIAQGRYAEANDNLPHWRASLTHDSHHQMSRYQAAAAFLAAKTDATGIAWDLCAKARTSAERCGAPTFQMTADIMVAAALAELDSLDGQADTLLQSVLSRCQAINPLLRWLALLMKTGIMARCTGNASAAKFARQAFTLGAHHSFWHFAFWPRDLVSRACEVAIQHGVEPAYTAALIRRNDLRPATIPFRLDGWPWRVKIRTLGRFALFVDGHVVKFGGKAQKTPIRLLQAIIALGGREVSESKLCDLLWPEADGDAAATSLGVTLHRLRRLLPAECLLRQDGKLSLDNRQVCVDAWAFERTLTDTEAIAQMTAADLRSLYQGAFLQELDSTPWVLPLRERLRGKLVTFVSAHSKRLFEAQLYVDAEHFLVAGLEIDDLVEDFYRALMRCQAARNDLSAALQTYSRCEAVLAARLAIQPSARTNALRAELLQRGGRAIGATSANS